jgi:hypothetical protein
MCIDIAKGLILAPERGKKQRKHGVFEDIRVVSRVVCVLITQHAAFYRVRVTVVKRSI